MKNKTAVSLGSASAEQPAQRPHRRLKIEERGDYFRKRTVPVVRLKGRWLQQAGFAPGQSLELTVVSPGVIELRVIGMVPTSVNRWHD